MGRRKRRGNIIPGPREKSETVILRTIEKGRERIIPGTSARERKVTRGSKERE
jgi:hypothetical protein